jgi:hypothetical protein
MKYHVAGITKVFDSVWDAIFAFEEETSKDYNNEDIASEEWFYDLCCDYIEGEDDDGNMIPFKSLET